MHPRTRTAVVRFWHALAVGGLDIGCVAPRRPGHARGAAQWRPFDSLQDVVADLDWLAGRNARGEAVYTRIRAIEGPADRHPGIVLVDDLDAAALRRLRAAGHRPSAVVLTSPGNHQVWLRACAVGSTITRLEAVCLARQLAAAYGGDPRAAASIQPGRLPGFTNRKPQYQMDRGFPYVLLLEANAGVCPVASVLLEVTRVAVDGWGERDTAPRRARAAGKAGSVLEEGVFRRAWEEEHARIQGEVRKGTRPLAAGTTSETDFAAVVALLSEGQSPQQVALSLSAARPDHGSTYASRTVSRATAYLADPTAFWLRTPCKSSRLVFRA